MNYLNNSVAIVTGASSGIGAATAKRLAKEGARVILAARQADKLERIVSEIKGAGGSAAYKVIDVARRDDFHNLVKFAEKTFGPVDILVNNAGLMLLSYWKDTAIDEWDRMIDTNIRGYLHGIAAVLPSMMGRKTGRILNIDSVAGIRTVEAGGVYSATKFFIRGVTESLRKEVGPDSSIQISMVSPGTIDTGWQDRVANNSGKDVAENAVKTSIAPEAIANAVAFALNQPPEVSIGDLIVAPTKQVW